MCAGDAMRLAQREDGVVGEIGNGLAMQLVRRAGIEFQIARQRQRVGARLLQRLADVAGFQFGQRVDARASTALPIRARTRPRSAAVSAPHAPEKAFCAAFTAASISSAVPAASVPMVSPVEGSSTGRVDLRGAPAARDEKLFVRSSGNPTFHEAPAQLSYPAVQPFFARAMFSRRQAHAPGPEQNKASQRRSPDSREGR